ncbi:MAG: hypothetical protein H6Q28_945, partial [Bacteroidetes bacterium]|nr:hypothetical protein [Bacteroidota bacterium]
MIDDYIPDGQPMQTPTIVCLALLAPTLLLGQPAGNPASGSRSAVQTPHENE